MLNIDFFPLCPCQGLGSSSKCRQGWASQHIFLRVRHSCARIISITNLPPKKKKFISMTSWETAGDCSFCSIFYVQPLQHCGALVCPISLNDERSIFSTNGKRFIHNINCYVGKSRCTIFFLDDKSRCPINEIGSEGTISQIMPSHLFSSNIIFPSLFLHPHI